MKSTWEVYLPGRLIHRLSTGKGLKKKRVCCFQTTIAAPTPPPRPPPYYSKFFSACQIYFFKFLHILLDFSETLTGYRFQLVIFYCADYQKGSRSILSARFAQSLLGIGFRAYDKMCRSNLCHIIRRSRATVIKSEVT